MEPAQPAAPPLSSAPTAAPPSQPAPHPYPDSVDSSPRSRNTDSWDEPPQPYAAATAAAAATGRSNSFKLRLMCSYGGHIFPRPHDKCLCYVGGETRMIVIDRQTTLSDLHHRLSKNFLSNSKSFALKYQLPNEDLDSLISVTTDEDLENMIEEYDRLTAASAASANPQKYPRLRLFLFPESSSSIGSVLENSTKSEDWFLNALNNGSTSTKGLSESSSVNCLLGLDEDNLGISNSNSSDKDVEAQAAELKGVSNTSNHSVSDLPALETTSSFGSTSSSPSLANLPPIRVRPEDLKTVGIEEQFSQMNVAGVAFIKNNSNNNIQQPRPEDAGFVALSSPPTVLASVPAAAVVSGVPVVSGVMVGDFPSRVFSDDERSDNSLPLAQATLPPQTQVQIQPTQFPQKPAIGPPLDLPSPDSVSSSDGSASQLSRPKPVTYQDTVVQMPSANIRVAANPIDSKTSDLNGRVQVQQQMHDSNYLMPTQLDLQHQQLLQHQQQQQQQQFVHAGAQFVHAGVHTGAAPMLYPVYPSHSQHHAHHTALSHQYPLYYVHPGQAQGYSLPVQPPNYTDSGTSPPSIGPQVALPTSMVPHTTSYNPARNSPASIPEMATGVYMSPTAATPPSVQVPSSQNQQQFSGLSSMPHVAQSIAPTSTAVSNYAYEYADSTRAQVYYAQHVAPPLAAQYQTMTPAASMVLTETAQLPSDNIRQQQ